MFEHSSGAAIVMMKYSRIYTKDGRRMGVSQAAAFPYTENCGAMWWKCNGKV
jgi:hypothetical protein